MVSVFLRSWCAELSLCRLQQHCANWGECMSFMYTHNWFHVGLFQLALGHSADALATFDARVWPDVACKDQRVFPRNDPKNEQDQLAALGLLWKAEMHGAQHLDQRWAKACASLFALSVCRSWCTFRCQRRTATCCSTSTWCSRWRVSGAQTTWPRSLHRWRRTWRSVRSLSGESTCSGYLSA